MSGPISSREWRLVRRPRGWPEPDDFALVTREVRDPRPGEVLVRNLFMSVDPYMRGRMNAGPSYAAAYELDRAMYGGAVGRVVRSASDRLPEGSVVRTSRGWREWFVCPDTEPEPVDATVAPPSAYLGVLGMPGLTAWVGLYDIGGIRPGETVFVSAASGAVGSIAGQLARLTGCRVVGAAGSAEKVRWITEELGFHAAFNYHDGDPTDQLRRVAPDGIDVYFDNVGGALLRAALDTMRDRGRVIACGMISSYNERQPGPDNLFHLVAKRITVRGFIVSDHTDRGQLFVRHVGELLRTGQLRQRETVVDGIESAVDALLDVLRGGRHLGKMLVRLTPDD